MTVKDSLLYTTCVVTCIICDSPHIMVCTIEVRVYTSIRYLVRYDLGDVYMCCYLLVLLKILCSLNLSMHPCSHAPNYWST